MNEILKISLIFYFLLFIEKCKIYLIKLNIDINYYIQDANKIYILKCKKYCVFLLICIFEVENKKKNLAEK